MAFSLSTNDTYLAMRRAGEGILDPVHPSGAGGEWVVAVHDAVEAGAVAQAGIDAAQAAGQGSWQHE